MNKYKLNIGSNERKEKPFRINKKFVKKKLNTKMSFNFSGTAKFEVDLPPLRKNKKRNKNNKIGGRNRSIGNKKRIMSPLIINRTRLQTDEDDPVTKYDEHKFLMYSVFRQGILDKVLKPLVKDIAKEAMESTKSKPRIKKKKVKSIINGRKIDPDVMKNFKYNPNNSKIIKLKELINRDYDLQK